MYAYALLAIHIPEAPSTEESGSRLPTQETGTLRRGSAAAVPPILCLLPANEGECSFEETQCINPEDSGMELTDCADA